MSHDKSIPSLCKIWGTKRVKRKPSFGKLGAGLQMFF